MVHSKASYACPPHLPNCVFVCQPNTPGTCGTNPLTGVITCVSGQFGACRAEPQPVPVDSAWVLVSAMLALIVVGCAFLRGAK
jgi:hypothetical protein